MKIRTALLLLIAPALACGLSGQQADQGEKSPMVQSGSVAVEKAKIYYDVAGNGSAVILIHGGLLTKEMWDGSFEKLARQYRVVRYDARNHGLSGSEEATFAHFADLKALMDGLKINKAVIMGLSLGGKIAIDFALKFPERVNGLILVAPGLSGYEFHGPENQAYDEKFNAAVKSGDSEKMIEAFMEAWTYGPRRSAEQVDPAVRDKIRSMARVSIKRGTARLKNSSPALLQQLIWATSRSRLWLSSAILTCRTSSRSWPYSKKTFRISKRWSSQVLPTW
jgi:pimeloyl-ACP methyl ester carboxylesterase